MRVQLAREGKGGLEQAADAWGVSDALLKAPRSRSSRSVTLTPLATLYDLVYIQRPTTQFVCHVSRGREALG